MEEDVRDRLDRVLDGYFDTKTTTMIERVLGTASSEELADDAAMDELFAAFAGLLEDRYDRADPGWRASADAFLRVEFERQLEAARAFDRAFEL